MSAAEAGIEVSLVAEAANGSEIAFARIVAAHHNDMARVAYVVCRDAQLAQEAALAAWTIAWRKLSTVRDPAKLRPWLCAIAANEARGLARRQGRRSIREIAVDPAVIGTAATSTAGDPADRIDAIDLSNALGRLEPTDRVIVGLRAAGLSSFEIGAAIGMSASGVRDRLGRALARLRKDLTHD